MEAELKKLKNFQVMDVKDEKNKEHLMKIVEKKKD